jgi:hypothetical protein
VQGSAKMLEASVLRNTFEVNREERIQEAKNLHNLELHNLCSSPSRSVAEASMGCFECLFLCYRIST